MPANRKRRHVRGGIDLGGTKIQAIVVDAEHTVLGSARRATPDQGGPQGVADEIAATLSAAAAAAGLEPSQLAGVGVGSPGAVDPAGNTVSSALNLPGWEGSFALGDALADALRTRVRIGNDVQVATNAEFELGAARRYDSLLGVFWGTGVGGGLVRAGEPWLGRGAAGEIGHVVIKLGGRRCTCGRRGCMEAYAGRGAMEIRARKRAGRGNKTALLDIMKQRGRTRMTSGVWARALEQGDKLAIRIIDEAVAALGAGIASTINILDVGAVVVGGGLGVRLGKPYVDRIAAAMQPHLFADSRPPAVQVAALGDLGGAIGAALLVADGSGPSSAVR